MNTKLLAKDIGLVIVAGGCLLGALFLTHRMGRITEIEEICRILDDRDEFTFRFHSVRHKERVNVLMRKVY